MLGERLVDGPQGVPEAARESRSMALLRTWFPALARSERAQGLAEYALILALIAIVAIIALIFLGDQISKILSDVGHSI
jgi:Flp pilus assembly pilin Flp